MRQKNKSFENLRDVHLRFVRLYARVLMQTGLTLPKYLFLSQLTAYGDLCMTDLSKRLLISKPAVTKIVRKLEHDRLIRKFACPGDRRSSILRICPKGKRLTLKAQKSILNFVLASLSALNKKEREGVEKFSSRLTRSMDAYLHNPKSVKEKRIC